MMRSNRLAALLLVPVLGLAGCATALSKFEPAREVSCFPSAKVSLTAAVETAEKQGGRAIDSHFHQGRELGCLVNEPASYEITLLSEGKLGFVSVNARSNKIESYRDKTTAWERAGHILGGIFANDPEEGARIAPSVALGLSDAIAIAENGGGKAMKAHLARKGDKAGYTVKLVDRGRLRVAWVDGGQTGFGARGPVGNAAFSSLYGAYGDEEGAYDEEEQAPDGEEDQTEG